jgi:hypothetical protein
MVINPTSEAAPIAGLRCVKSQGPDGAYEIRLCQHQHRLLKKAVKIGVVGTDWNGRALHRLAPDMQEVFGGFGGNTSIQRSPPRWVAPEFTQHAARFISAFR